ncbi:unnamed protein product, partial [Musa acuminata var. zebrina]
PLWFVESGEHDSLLDPPEERAEHPRSPSHHHHLQLLIDLRVLGSPHQANHPISSWTC